MNVLLLTPYPHRLIPAFQGRDTYMVSMDAPDQWPEADYVVSFGYRRTIKEPYLSKYKDRLINIHISWLPWNRGSDPNFWSWFDDTPKGVSIHLIDEGIDTGTIVSCAGAPIWGTKETLKSSHNRLLNQASMLFCLEWTALRQSRFSFHRRLINGSYHKSADKDPWMAQLPLGWNTPVKDVQNLRKETHV